MLEENLCSELTPVRVSVLKKMEIGDLRIFRNTKYNQASSAISKVPEFLFKQQTSLVTANNVEPKKVILVKRIK